MGKSAPSPPAAPDPTVTAAAQTASNKDTALYNAQLNRPNQTTPYGTVSWDYNGDANNPQWSQTTTPSAAEQPIVDNTLKGQQIYSDTAVNELNNAKAALSQPVSTDYSQYTKNGMDAALGRIAPQQKMQEEQLRSRLLNSGIPEGSEAWNNAYRQFNQGQNDLLLQATANAPNYAGQAIQQQAALRAQPINEASALLSGGQVSIPNLTPTQATATQAPTDVLGAYQQQYQGELNSYNAQLQNQSAQMGGLYGLLGTGASAGAYLLRSDERLKEDISRVGKTNEGTPIYTYSYKDDPTGTTHMGVMAQELIKKRPDAVHTMPDGMYAVDYRKVS